MSWVKENCVSFFQLLCIKVVKTGRVPQHIAFIMDGNRRYAKKNSVKASDGHHKGFDKLSETLKNQYGIDSKLQWSPQVEALAGSLNSAAYAVRTIRHLSDEATARLVYIPATFIVSYHMESHCGGKQQWCLDLGIPEVTVYAFSIENFKRSQDEVDTLMDLARDKFQRLLDELDQINEWGIRVHVAGRLSLLPDDLKAHVSRAMLATRHNDKLRLNIAYAYTGRDEISRAASHLVAAVNNKELAAGDIDEALVTRTLELGEAELLVRTSGEVRLSDFMLWQVSKTVLYFSDVLWPEFSIYNLLGAIIHFQRYAPHFTEAESLSEDKQKFLTNLESQRWLELEKFVSCTS